MTIVMSIKIFPMTPRKLIMAKYTRAQVFSFIDNTNPANGVHAVLTDEPIRCDYWTEPDPVTGDPVEMSWCPLEQDYEEYKFRMSLEFALRIHENPNQSMLYLEKSAALQAAWDATSPANKSVIKNWTWSNYGAKWAVDPNAVPAPEEQ